MTAEPIYLEKVDSYLVDEFHKGLFELTLGLWADVLHGDWYCHLDFFNLNFSGQPGSQGALAKEFPIGVSRVQSADANHNRGVMQERIRAVVNEGRIEPLDKLDLPDGTQVLVTVLTNGDDFLLRASEVSLNAIWDNPEDDVYAELLKG